MFFIVCLLSAFAILLLWGNRRITEDKEAFIEHSKSTWKSDLKDIEKLIWKLDGFQFEEFCSMLFSLNGIKNDVTSKTGDGGKDLILRTKEGKIYVECKHYAPNNAISSPLIIKLIGSCSMDNIDKALFITTSYYSKDAIDTMDNSQNVEIKRFYLNDILDMSATNTKYVLNWLYDRI